MATFLFENIIVGPLKSRRLGISLGVNLLPTNRKLCNFNCIYCECGWNKSGDEKLKFATKDEVEVSLKQKLSDMHSANEKLDVITFAGNGEPTLHPQFAEIVDSVIEIRNKYYPEAKIAVLSNATMINREHVRKALNKIDSAILKIDSALAETIKIINNPNFNYNLDEVVDNMKMFKGDVIIQTMFLRGEHNGKYIDNTTEEEVSAWVKVVLDVKPKTVMIYTIDRDTPADFLEKVEYEELERIADIIRSYGIECTTAEQ